MTRISSGKFNDNIDKIIVSLNNEENTRVIEFLNFIKNNYKNLNDDTVSYFADLKADPEKDIKKDIINFIIGQKDKQGLLNKSYENKSINDYVFAKMFLHISVVALGVTAAAFLIPVAIGALGLLLLVGALVITVLNIFTPDFPNVLGAASVPINALSIASKACFKAAVIIAPFTLGISLGAAAVGATAFGAQYAYKKHKYNTKEKELNNAVEKLSNEDGDVNKLSNPKETVKKSPTHDDHLFFNSSNANLEEKEGQESSFNITPRSSEK